jgi:hypothetical protein
MAAKKTTTKRAASKRSTKKAEPGTGLRSYDEMFAELQAQAQEEAGRETAGSGSSRIAAKGHRFIVDDTDLGESIQFIVLDYAFVNVFYDRPYDPGSENNAPACYAVSEDEAELAGAEDAPVPQHEDGPGSPCATCWANQFESADTGRGKACGNRRRLIGILVSDIEEHGADGAPLREMNLPPSSLKHWGRYVRGLARLQKLPPHGVITEFTCDPESDYQVPLPTFVEPIGPDILGDVLSRRDEAHELAIAPLDVSNYEPPQPKGRAKKATTKAKAKTGKRY